MTQLVSLLQRLLLFALVFFIAVDSIDDSKLVGEEQLLEKAGTPVQVKYLRRSDGAFTIFLRTEQGKVFKNDRSGLGSWDLQLPNSKYPGPFTATDLISHWKNPNKLLIVNKKGNVAITVGALSAEKQLAFDIVSVSRGEKESVAIEKIKQHPQYPDYLLLAAFVGDCGDLDAAQLEDTPVCARKVYGSNDFGYSWSFLQDYVYEFDFMPLNIVENCPYVKKGNSFFPFLHRSESQVVIMMAIASEKERQKSQDLFSWHDNVNLVLSANWFQTEPIIIKQHMYSFAFIGKHLYAAQVDSREHASVTLEVSHDGGWSFENVKMPFILQQQAFHIMSAEKIRGENAILAVLHGMEDTKPFYNLYLSDKSGTRFSLSLRRTIFEDLSLIRGVQGMMITNAYDPVAPHLDRPRTLISFDNGGVWHRLVMNTSSVPRFQFYQRNMENGKYFRAPENSELVLLGSAASTMGENTFESAYSLNSTAGYILAHGVLLPGPEATLRSDTASLWLSTNGGTHWLEILGSGHYTFEYGDSGSLIVAAKTDASALYYTWTSGLSWSTIPFPQNNMIIHNILSEPEAKTERMLLLGSRDNDGIVVFLDFSTLSIRTCEDASNPVILGKIKPCNEDPTLIHDIEETISNGESDYCSFCPADALDGRCPLGRRVCYLRRRQEVLCNNRDGFASILSSESCPCTMDDYQCDIGFERSSDSSECHPSYGVDIENDDAASCNAIQSRGYVLIPGDTCNVETGLNLLPSRSNCVVAWMRNLLAVCYWLLSVSLALCLFVLLGGWMKGDFEHVSSLEEAAVLILGEIRSASILVLMMIQWLISGIQQFLENIIHKARDLSRGYVSIDQENNTKPSLNLESFDSTRK
eukprot:jgi/Galph1/250/GphlegSOOS_G4955.1